MKNLELKLFLLRYKQIKVWLRVTSVGRGATTLGMFIMVYVSMAVMIIATMLILNINPTLVISVVAAPLWIAVLLTAWYIAKWFSRK